MPCSLLADPSPSFRRSGPCTTRPADYTALIRSCDEAQTFLAGDEASAVRKE